jgi:hypothetical protein
VFIPLEKFQFSKSFDVDATKLKDLPSDMSVARLCQKAFEEGRAAGIKEIQNMKSRNEKTQTHHLFEKILKELGTRNTFRIKYEAHAAKAYIALLKDVLICLFPTLEDRWRTLETAVFLRNFLKTLSEESHTVRITLPQELLSELKKYFEKSGEVSDPRITWVATDNPEGSAVQVCWRDGGVNYARTQLFSEILRILEVYASQENGEQIAINGEKE